RHLGYFFAWPGLDAKAFLRGAPVERPAAAEWVATCVKPAIGALLVWVVVPLIPEEHELLRGWVGMVGFILVMTFGLFHLLSCAWRSAGVDARPLMRSPLLAQSVSEFWGRRW